VVVLVELHLLELGLVRHHHHHQHLQLGLLGLGLGWLVLGLGHRLLLRHHHQGKGHLLRVVHHQHQLLGDHQLSCV